MYVEKAYSTFDSDSSVGRVVKPGGPLTAFRAGTGFHLLLSFHLHPTVHNTITLHIE